MNAKLVGNMPHLATLPSCLVYIRPFGTASGGTVFKDWSSYHRALTCVGSAVNTTSTVLYPPASINLPTDTAGVSWGADSAFAFGTGDFTILATFSLPSLGNSSSDPNAILCGATSYSSWIYWALPQTGSVGFDFYISGTDATNTTFAWQTNTKYQVVAIRSSGTLNCYINGSNVLSTASATSVPADTGGYRMGLRPSYSLKGIIDEFAIFNKAIPISNLYPQTQRLIV
jgi:hypothetical protein